MDTEGVQTKYDEIFMKIYALKSVTSYNFGIIHIGRPIENNLGRG